MAVSNVSLMTLRSIVRSRAKGMRMNALRQAPAAPARWASAASLGVCLAAVVGAAFAGARHPRLDRMVAGLEGKHHDRDTAVGSAGVERLLGVEDAAIRRIKPGLRDRPQGPGRREEIRELDRAAGAEFRPILQPHPGLRDDAQNALRADQQTVGARSRA